MQASRPDTDCIGACSKTLVHVARLPCRFGGHMLAAAQRPFTPLSATSAGDLGAIDAKFDVAVSTSCAALDYIVVEDTATAQKCVDMLRR